VNRQNWKLLYAHDSPLRKRNALNFFKIRIWIINRIIRQHLQYSIKRYNAFIRPFKIRNCWAPLLWTLPCCCGFSWCWYIADDYLTNRRKRIRLELV
jgi:hypothetical protein